MTARESRRANREAIKAIAEANRANAKSREATLQTIEARLSGGDAYVAIGHLEDARDLYNKAWDLSDELGISSLPAQLAIWEMDYESGRPIGVVAQNAEIPSSSLK